MPMALSLSLSHIFVIFFLSFATACCKAQQADPVQMVARAALCFDNRTVTNNCTRWMRNSVAAQNSSNSFCNSPCYGQMLLILNCMDGILSNFQFYSPGIMQGMQSVIQMSCGGRANNNTNTSTSGNMVAGPVEGGAEVSMHKYMASLLIIVLVSGLILYV